MQQTKSKRGKSLFTDAIKSGSGTLLRRIPESYIKFEMANISESSSIYLTIRESTDVTSLHARGGRKRHSTPNSRDTLHNYRAREAISWESLLARPVESPLRPLLSRGSIARPSRPPATPEHVTPSTGYGSTLLCEKDNEGHRDVTSADSRGRLRA